MNKFVFSTRMIEYDDLQPEIDYLFSVSAGRCTRIEDNTNLRDVFVLSFRHILQGLKDKESFLKEGIEAQLFNNMWDALFSTNPKTQNNPGSFYNIVINTDNKKELIRKLLSGVDKDHKDYFMKYGYCWKLENKDIYAVYQLNTPKSSRISDLVNQFKKDMNANDTLFLLLHDKDVPNQSGVVKIVKNTSKYYTNNDPKVKVVLFNHTKNWVVSILETLQINDIEKKITSSYDNAEHVERIISNPTNNNRTFFQNLAIDGAVDGFDAGNSPIDFKEENDCYVYEDSQGRLLNELMHGSFNMNSDDNPNNPFLSLIQKIQGIGSVRSFKIISPEIKGIIDYMGNKITLVVKESTDVTNLTPIIEVPKDVSISPSSGVPQNFTNTVAYTIGKQKFMVSTATDPPVHKPLIIKLYKSFFKDWEDFVDPFADKEKIRNHPNNIALKKNLETICSFFNNSSIWIRIVDIKDK